MAESSGSAPRILIAGGGTGGHLFPALAIQEAIREITPEARFAFVGTRRGIEARVLPERGEELFYLRLTGFQRGSVTQNIATGFRLAVSMLQSRKILANFKPDIVIGTGGYVMGPVLFLAQRRNIPTLLQEQNSYPGLTTRKLAPRASAVCIAFDDAAKRLNTNRTHLTGNPVRSTFESVNREQALKSFGLRDDRETILIVGGSQGAKSINLAIAGCLEKLLQEYSVIWQAGRHGVPDGCQDSLIAEARAKKSLCIREFIDDMPAAYGAADLAICRAGAMTIAELAICGLPAIFVPFPHATDDHQTANARSLVDDGAAELIADSDLTSDIVLENVHSIMHSSSAIESMRLAMRKFAKPNAAKEIAKLALSLISK